MLRLVAVVSAAVLLSRRHWQSIIDEQLRSPLIPDVGWPPPLTSSGG